MPYTCTVKTLISRYPVVNKKFKKFVFSEISLNCLINSKDPDPKPDPDSGGRLIRNSGLGTVHFGTCHMQLCITLSLSPFYNRQYPVPRTLGSLLIE